MIPKIDEYITNFNSEHNKTTLPKWMHDNPTATKVIQVALIVLGVAAIATFPLSLAAMGVGVTIGIAVLGVVAILTSVASWIFINYITCKGSDITKHAFKESSCQGGRLYYKGNVPILELTGKTPFQSGQAHGYLLGSHINELYSNFQKAIYGVLQQPRPRELQKMLAEFQAIIPDRYKDEMQGLADGYNNWALETGAANRLTMDDILLMHLVPESKHFHTKQMTESSLKSGKRKTQELPELAAAACTAILSHDAKGNLIFGRNMDWSPFGDGGAQSLVIVWPNTGVAVLGVPGMIGAIQGWNRDRLTLSMNVCPGDTDSVRGIPAAIFNRMVLEHSPNVPSALAFSQYTRPLGPYHLTVADRHNEGTCISFYQNADVNDRDHVRTSLRDADPLLVVNWRYPDCEGGSFNSAGRTVLLTKYFREAPAEVAEGDRFKLVANALKLTPLVNSWITMHSLMIEPASDRISMSWGNGYAAAQQSQQISMSSVFEPSQGAHEAEHKSKHELDHAFA